MKHIIFASGFIILISMISGCNNTKRVVENNTGDNNGKTQKVENIEYIDSMNKEELEKVLGSEEMPENEKLNIDSETIEIKECDKGFIYHVELNECFKIGAVTEEKYADVKINPIVKECIDKGGIYNTQAEKCFIN